MAAENAFIFLKQYQIPKVIGGRDSRYPALITSQLGLITVLTEHWIHTANAAKH